jgi:hypothetical protein
MQWLAWLQNTEFSTWTRESDWALFAFLIIHTIGMGTLVGLGIVMNLRILGAASQIPLTQLNRLVPIMWIGLAVAICSGVLLVVSYPAKAVTNPVFYLKLTLVTSAVVITRTYARRLFNTATDEPLPKWVRPTAMICLLLWAGGLTAGKFLAYTNRILLIE